MISGGSAQEFADAESIEIHIAYSDARFIGRTFLESLRIKQSDGRDEISKRRRKISEMMKSGKKRKEITSALGISNATYDRDRRIIEGQRNQT